MIVDGQIKSVAYGNDVYGENVTHVSEDIQRGVKLWKPVPMALSEELQTYTASFALNALTRMRTLLGGLGSDTEDQSISHIFEDQLTWKELIHTAYFDVDNFVKLVAVSLCESGLVSPSDKLKNDPDYDKVVGWYQEMKPGPEGAVSA